MNHNESVFFGIFIVVIIGLLMVDLLLIGRKSHKIGFREALIWTCVWIGFAIGFYFLLRAKGDFIHNIQSKEDIQALIERFRHPLNIDGLTFEESLRIYRNNLSLEYITGYLIEYSLSVDNVFVMILIFMGFGVRDEHYKRVLFWGILGAIIMRFIFIFLSAALIQRFEWVLYIFGAFLVFTGVKMFMDRNKDDKIDVQHHPIVKFTSKYFKVFPKYVSGNFFVKKEGRVYITPLFIVLLVIEFSDVIFAVDSVPAIFSVTKDPYIVFFSNIFAIIGLRSLFFLVINVIKLFRFLKIGLSVLLTFIGVKMLIHTWLEEIGFSTQHSLIIILSILGVSILASILIPEKKKVSPS